jgi:hypothetical protein
MSPGWTIQRHVVAWLVLAICASLYLAKLYYFPPPERPAAESGVLAQGAENGSPFGDDGAEQDFVSVEEVESLRSEIAALRQQVGTLRRRLTRVEEAFGPTTGALPPQEDAERSTTGSLGEEKADPPPLPPVTVSLSPLPKDGFGDTMIDISPLPVANERMSSRTLFGVELASGSTADQLEREWAALNERSAVSRRAWRWSTLAPASSQAAAAAAISSGVSGRSGCASFPWTPPVSAAVMIAGFPSR